jgi:hypothetical protein
VSTVIHTGVLLLAHKRLRAFENALDLKLGTAQFSRDAAGNLAPVVKRDLDRRVLALARAAIAMIEGGTRIEVPARSVLGFRVSRYAVLGSLGIEWPALVDQLEPGEAWITEVMRHGSPDPNTSLVVNGAPEFWLQVGKKALARTGRDAEKDARIRAFVMGGLAALASDVVVNPVLRGLQQRRTRREWDRYAPAGGILDAEARIARQLLGNPTGRHWDTFWPAPADIPEELLQGYLEALEQVFHVSAAPPGFGEAMSGFTRGATLTTAMLRDAYTVFRTGELALGKDWSWVHWWGLLLPLFVMPALAVPIALGASDEARKWLQGPADARPDLTGRSWLDLLGTGLIAGTVVPAIYQIILGATGAIPRGHGGWVTTIVIDVLRVIFEALFLILRGTGDDGWATAFLVLAAIADLAGLIGFFVFWAKGQMGSRFLMMLQWFPVLTMLMVLALAGIFRAAHVTWEDPGWVALAVILAALVLAGLAMIPAALIAHFGGFTIYALKESRANINLLGDLPGDPRTDPAALAALFDDSTLWRDRDAAGPVTLASMRYPAGPRPLMRMWWTGANPLRVQHGGAKLTFLRSDSSTQVVRLPPALTAAGLADLLQRTVVDAGGAPGSLHAEAIDATPRYPLPFPHTLSDPGDDEETLDGHGRHAGDARTIGADRAHATVLTHAHRADLTTGFGVNGPSATDIDAHKIVPSSMLGDTEFTAMGHAADLAALLMMGAAPALAESPIRVGGVELKEAYQVFRLWNLDARRVNEWRMIVAGGAASEKAGSVVGVDPAMRPVPTAPPYAPRAGEAEPVATAMGWVPLWRAWSRVATDVTADSAATAAMSYTPPASLPDGRRAPTNDELTRALRFLLDLE